VRRNPPATCLFRPTANLKLKRTACPLHSGRGRRMMRFVTAIPNDPQMEKTASVRGPVWERLEVSAIDVGC
jgi:hypothetical protein